MVRWSAVYRLIVSVENIEAIEQFEKEAKQANKKKPKKQKSQKTKWEETMSQYKKESRVREKTWQEEVLAVHPFFT
jgi:hypothetical protein